MPDLAPQTEAEPLAPFDASRALQEIARNLTSVSTALNRGDKDYALGQLEAARGLLEAAIENQYQAEQAARAAALRATGRASRTSSLSRVLNEAFGDRALFHVLVDQNWPAIDRAICAAGLPNGEG